MDDRLRRNERESDADKDDAVALSDLLRERQRRGETAADLAGKLAEYAEDTRKGAYRLLAMNEDEQVLQEALIFFGQQIDHARELAIQPREDDAPLPEREAILNSVQRTLTPDQARVFLDKKEVREPRLILVPVTSVERYIEALQQASENMEDALGPNFEDFARIQLRTLASQAEVEGNKIKKWKFAITEGAQIFPVPTWDNGQGAFRDRIEDFDTHYALMNISRLNSPSYLALMHQGLRQGKPIDIEQYTLLYETGEETIEGITHDLIVHGDCLNSRHVNLRKNYGGNLDLRARFRPAVIVDIQ